MKKLIATTCVVAWFFAGAFGYLALTAPQDDNAQIMIDMVLAMAGLAVGLTTWVSLARGDAGGLPDLDPSLRLARSSL